MITAAERRAKIEKLRRDREAKEKERTERQEREQQAKANASTSNNLINQILAHNTEANEQLTQSQTMATAGQVQQQKQNAVNNRLPLRVSSHVVELEIAPRRPADKYDKEIMCDLPDPRQQRLGAVNEADEFQNDFDNRFADVQQRM